MSIRNYFYYDEEKCHFRPVDYPSLERVVNAITLWVLCGVVLSGMGIIILSHFAGTPSEIALKAENRELVAQLKRTQATIIEIDQMVDVLAKQDNEIYRTVLGIEPISDDERRAGVGGNDIYEKFNSLSEESAELLKWTASNIDQLERRVNIQKISFEEIKEYYNSNRQKLSHLPAIRPVKGIIISSYGMRFHPIYKFYRMHKGLDFRAKEGDTVYATGDGVIKYAKNKGTLGLTVAIDHEFGFESRYGHLSALQKGIKAGSKVKRGDVIGYSGRSGVVEGPHLHYEISKDGRSVDPINYLFGDLTPQEYNEFLRIAENNPNSMD